MGGGGQPQGQQNTTVPLNSTMNLEPFYNQQYQSLTDRLNMYDQFSGQVDPIVAGQLNDVSQRAYGQNPADFWKADAEFTQRSMGQRQALRQDVDSAIQAIQRYQDSQDQKQENAMNRAERAQERADSRSDKNKANSQAATETAMQQLNNIITISQQEGDMANVKKRVWSYLHNIERVAAAQGIDMGQLWAVYNALQKADYSGTAGLDNPDSW